jgi:hypothetical protein
LMVKNNMIALFGTVTIYFILVRETFYSYY